MLEKGKYTLLTITRLTVFMRAFCRVPVENLLKDPEGVVMFIVYQ